MDHIFRLHKSARHFAICALFLMGLPVTGVAQDWVTPDVCDISDAEFAAADKYLSQITKDKPLTKQISNGTGRFWQVTSPNGAVSYLWGTMHSSQRAALDLPPAMQKQLDAARILSLEIDYRHRDRASLEAANAYQGWWQDLYLPPKPMPVIATADPRIEGWVYDRIIAAGIDPSYAGYLTPGGLLSMLLSNPCEDFTGGTIPYQDNFIKTLAHINGTPVLGLEPATQTFTDLNAPENHAFAEALITSYGAYLMPREDSVGTAMSLLLYTRGEIGRMMALDHAYLTEMLGPQAKDIIALRDQFLLENRNRAFLDASMAEFETGGMFMAVGAFHLPGEHGLVAMLRAKGFAVERIDVEGGNEQRYR